MNGEPMTNPVDTDALRDMGAALTTDGHTFGPRIVAAADELDRLCAVIESAPHTAVCFQVLLAGKPCTCWKAEAL